MYSVNRIDRAETTVYFVLVGYFSVLLGMIRVKKAPYQGIILQDYGIGLDLGSAKQPTQFVSHAHADHLPKRNDVKVFCSATTATFMRLRGFKGQIECMEWEEWKDFGNFSAQLLPAGHILGSAMIHIKSDEGTLLYTGDYRFPAAPTTEGFCLPESVDVFITEATFGLPIYKWDSHKSLFEQICFETESALEEGLTPIFTAYSLGKTQEILHALKPLGRKVQVHGAAFALSEVYATHSVAMAEFERYDRSSVEGSILITPGSALANGTASNVKKKRLIYVSGWATHEARRTQLGADRMIALSDHINFFELLKVCEHLAPKKIWVTHTPDPSVVSHYLQKSGYDVSFLDIEREEEDL